MRIRAHRYWLAEGGSVAPHLRCSTCSTQARHGNTLHDGSSGNRTLRRQPVEGWGCYRRRRVRSTFLYERPDSKGSLDNQLLGRTSHIAGDWTDPPKRLRKSLPSDVSPWLSFSRFVSILVAKSSNTWLKRTAETPTTSNKNSAE